MAPKNDKQKDKDQKPKGQKLFQIGGETITVTVSVNGIRKFSRSATLADDETDERNDNVRRYTTDKGGFILKKRSLGIKKLAIDLLKE